MKISSNITAMMIVGNMEKAGKNTTTAMERLSSGLKINSSSDNPAGWAIANKLDVQAQGLNKANQNSMDAISLVQTTEGALNEIHNMLNRIRELTVQSISDSNTAGDRASIQSEIDELISEISTVSERTDFNGIRLLDSDEKVMIQTGGNAYEAMEISAKDINLDDVRKMLSGYSVMKNKDSETIDKINDAIEVAEKTGIDDSTLLNTIDDIISASSEKDNKLIKEITDILGGSGDKIDLIKKAISRPEPNEKDVADNLLNIVDGAIDNVSKIRGLLGAYQNRLEHTVINLAASEENTIASLSRIQDADMAEEMSEYTLQNVIAQAGNAMLAQANQRPQQVLQLLNS